MKKIFGVFISLFIGFYFINISFAQQLINGSILHDDIQRTYTLYIPNSYNPDQEIPLLFNFHGYGSNSNEQMIYGNFRPIADTANFIIIHPQGTEDATGSNHWNVGWGTSTVDDIGFVNALIDSIILNYNIDESRIYSTGMSNGGFLSYKLVCELSSRFAAIASVTGSMTSGQIENCNPDHSIPILEIHGTSDFVVPYNGSALFSSIPDVLDFWVTFNNCNPIPFVEELPDLDPDDGSTVTQILYSQGNTGTEVKHFKINNGTHTWPGSIFDLGGTNYDIDASTEIWLFLSKYDINGLINPTSTYQEPETTPSIRTYPNPFSEFIILESKQSNSNEYQVLSACGQIVSSGKTQTLSTRIHLRHLKNGVYFIKIGNQYYRIIKN